HGSLAKFLQHFVAAKSWLREIADAALEYHSGLDALLQSRRPHDDGLTGYAQLLCTGSDVAEVLIDAHDVLEDGDRFVELPLAFKVEREVVQRVFHTLVNRALAEFLECHVEHALALEREAEHIVG